MPIHDWTRVDAGLFHDFHQSWTVYLSDALNGGRLPADYFTLLDYRRPGFMADVSTLNRSDRSVYADKANRITLRNRQADIVAVIEIVSPGNKGSKAEFQAFIQQSTELIRKGIHLLVIDLFPLGLRGSQGIHKAIWEEFQEEDLKGAPGKPLTLASYDAGPPQVAYVEEVGVGDLLPDMPLFLKPELYLTAPLEATYQTAWAHFPKVMKRLLEPPAAP